MDAHPRVLIVGCGDVGRRLARLLLAAGHRVSGLVVTAASAETLAAEAVTPLQVDLDTTTPEALHTAFDRAAARWLFWFAPPPNKGHTDPRLRHALAALTLAPQRLVYLSTSGVYGDCEGEWVDESAPLRPRTERARRRVDAEAAVREYAEGAGCEALILRVPGIYGPGRLPLARLREGRPILRAEDAPFSNRIHAEDLAAAAQCVAEAGEAGSVYNVGDGHPTSMSDYFLRCAALLGLSPPPQVDMATARRDFSESLLSFVDESKRLKTDRLRALGWAPRYPDLAAGLPSCLDA